VLDDIDFDGAYINLTFDAYGDVVGIIGNPNSEGIGVFEDAVDHQLGFDFDAANFAKVGFDDFLTFIGDGQIVDLVVDVHIHRKLFARCGVGIIEIPQVVDGGSHVLGVLRDGEFALFVAQFAVVVVVDGHILVEIIVFSHGFGIAQGRLRFLVDPALKFVAHFVGPVEAFHGFPFYAQVVGGFAIDDGGVGVNDHRHYAGIDGAIVDAVFEGFAGLIGEVGNFAGKYHGGCLFIGGQGG